MGSRLGHVLTEKPQASTLTSQGLELFIGKRVCLAFLLVVLRQIIYMKNVANYKLHQNIVILFEIRGQYLEK